jgi:hypothetical protein
MDFGSSEVKGIHQIIKEIWIKLLLKPCGFCQLYNFRDQTTDLHRDLFLTIKLIKNASCRKSHREEVITVVDMVAVSLSNNRFGISAMEVVMTKLHAGGNLRVMIINFVVCTALVQAQ